MKLRLKKEYTILFIPLLVCFSLQGVEPYQPKIVNPLSQSWRWKLFPELEGKGIRNIYEEEKDKTVWISFNEGIYEYDGYNWKIHNQDNGLTDSPVEFVFVNQADKVFAASSDGIFALEGKQWVNKFPIPEDITVSFKNLKELDSGMIVAPSNIGLVLLADDGTIKIISSQDQLERLRSYFHDVSWGLLPNELTQDDAFEDISDVILDHDGLIWLALTMPNEKGRILTFRKEQLQKDSIQQYQIYSSDEKKKFGEAQQLLEAQDGSIWVINSTYKTGISIWRNGTWEYINLSDRFSGDEYMTNIVETDDGTIWIGALGKLYAYKNKKWTIYSAPTYPIPANRLVLQKGKGNYLWVAGYKSKVYFLDFSFDTWISYQDLNFQFQDQNNDSWFIDINGKVIHQDDSKWFAYDTRDGLIDAPVRVIQTSTGQIWAAGSHQGVAATAVYEEGRWKKQLHPSLSWGVDYRSIFEDKDGAIWIGAAVDAENSKGQKSGVLKLIKPTEPDKEWIHYPSGERGLNQSNVYGIGQSTDGRMWIGGGNLFGFDGTSWQRHVHSRLQQFVNVVCSTDELLAAGSRYYGVFLFDGNEWKNYDNDSGLSGNTIISIDIVTPDRIYVATENDICRFDGKGWVNNVFPADLNMEFEGGTLLHDNAGNVWINKADRAWKRRAFQYSKTQKGESYCFITHKYVPDKTPPETSILMYSEEVNQAGNTLIKWGGKDYYAQSANKDLMYSYKLGDGEWSPFIKDQHFTFTRLSHGEHTLQVRARDLDLNVDPTPATVVFTVLPPVWKQAWFISLILAFLLVIAIFEYRVLRKKRKLEILNDSLHKVNEKLVSKSKKIELQNQEILQQQKHIIEQAKTLESTNKNLEERNTEIKLQKDQLEEMVVQVEELSKTKLSFFTNISHELRTPLTLITGPINQLIDQGSSLSEASRQNLYHIIDRNSSRLLKLINQLLEFRRIEESNLELNYINIDFPFFLQGIIDMFENLALDKGIYLDFSNKHSIREVRTDPDKIEKIIVNLLANAFKHTQEGDSIRIGLDICQQETSSPCLALSIEDTGCGIREKDLQYIYQRFFSRDIKEIDPNSSGLGLAYTKQLVDLLEGNILVESELGIGTKFIIHIPYSPADQPITEQVSSLKIAQQEAANLMKNLAAKKTSLQKTKSGNSLKRVLVVEDNLDMQLFIESILETEYLVIKAENGIEGLKIAEAHNIDLIISDVMMPQMDGLTFCKKIKENIATSHIPVLLLTAKNLDENKIEGYSTGADGYLTKPFNPKLLQTRIFNLLSQREVLRSAFNRDFMLTPEKIQLSSPDEELLKKVIEIMEKHLDDSNFNVNKMCKMVHLSHMHFIRKVKQLTGKKPIDLLKSFRLKRAKDLLLQNKLSISEVAYQVGYDLPNSFSRAFKKEFGMSPKKFIELQDQVKS